MQQLEKVHKQLHFIVKQIIELKHAGNDSMAEQEYEKLEPLSDEIRSLLNILEKKIK